MIITNQRAFHSTKERLSAEFQASYIYICIREAYLVHETTVVLERFLGFPNQKWLESPFAVVRGTVADHKIIGPSTAAHFFGIDCSSLRCTPYTIPTVENTDDREIARASREHELAAKAPTLLLWLTYVTRLEDVISLNSTQILNRVQNRSTRARGLRSMRQRNAAHVQQLSTLL